MVYRTTEVETIPPTHRLEVRRVAIILIVGMVALSPTTAALSQTAALHVETGDEHTPPRIAQGAPNPERDAATVGPLAEGNPQRGLSSDEPLPSQLSKTTPPTGDTAPSASNADATNHTGGLQSVLEPLPVAPPTEKLDSLFHILTSIAEEASRTTPIGPINATVSCEEIAYHPQPAYTASNPRPIWQPSTTNSLCGGGGGGGDGYSYENEDDSDDGGSCLDQDRDGVCDVWDNCPRHSNGGQADIDRDGEGDACEGSGAGITECKSPIVGDRDGDGVPDGYDIDRDCDRIENALENALSWDPDDDDTDGDELLDHKDMEPNLPDSTKLNIEIKALTIKQHKAMDPTWMGNHKWGEPYLNSPKIGLANDPGQPLDWAFSLPDLRKSDYESDCETCEYPNSIHDLGQVLSQDINAQQYANAKACTYCPPKLQIRLPLLDKDATGYDDEAYFSARHTTSALLTDVSDKKGFEFSIVYRDGHGDKTATFRFKLSGSVSSCGIKVMEAAHRYGEEHITAEMVGYHNGRCN